MSPPVRSSSAACSELMSCQGRPIRAQEPQNSAEKRNSEQHAWITPNWRRISAVFGPLYWPDRPQKIPIWPKIPEPRPSRANGAKTPVSPGFHPTTSHNITTKSRLTRPPQLLASHIGRRDGCNCWYRHDNPVICVPLMRRQSTMLQNPLLRPCSLRNFASYSACGSSSP